MNGVRIFLAKSPTLNEITSKRWEDITSLDDCVLEGEREVLDKIKKELESGDLCRFLKKDGKYFYFCSKGMNEEDKKDNKLEPSNKKYRQKIDVASLQIYCIGRYEHCCFYNGDLRK